MSEFVLVCAFMVHWSKVVASFVVHACHGDSVQGSEWVLSWSAKLDLIRIVFGVCFWNLKDMVVNCSMDVMVSVKQSNVNRSLNWEKFRCSEYHKKVRTAHDLTGSSPGPCSC